MKFFELFFSALLVLLFVQINSFGQSNVKNDSISNFSIPTEENYPENLDSLWKFNEEINDSMMTDLGFKPIYSIGWFPKILFSDVYTNLILDFGTVYDWTHGLRSNSFAPTRGEFWGSSPKDEEREIHTGFNSDDKEDDYLQTELFSIGLDFKFPLVYSYIKTGVGYTHRNGMLFTKGITKHLINFKDELKSITEVSAFHLNEKQVYGKCGIEIPFYGAYMNAGEQIYSYYYLYSGIRYNYSFISTANQFNQIIKGKDELRFPNGKDTIFLMKDVDFTGSNKGRYYIDLELGMASYGAGYGFDFSVYCSFNVTSVLKDTRWNQVDFGIKYGINIDAFSKMLFNAIF